VRAIRRNLGSLWIQTHLAAEKNTELVEDFYVLDYAIDMDKSVDEQRMERMGI
jgi:hypothetical protein